jgi:hypothetical protein
MNKDENLDILFHILTLTDCDKCKYNDYCDDLEVPLCYKALSKIESRLYYEV